MNQTLENTYTPKNIEDIGVDWDSYQEMMSRQDMESREDDRWESSDQEVQRTIRNWNPSDENPPEEDTVEYWMS